MAHTYKPGPPSTIFRNLSIFLGLWIGLALAIFASGFVMQGWAAVAVGASERELSEFLETFSVPLGWASPVFVITRNTSFSGVCGIIFANSYFYALVLFPFLRLVQAARHRNRVTQLGLSRRRDEERDDR